MQSPRRKATTQNMILRKSKPRKKCESLPIPDKSSRLIKTKIKASTLNYLPPLSISPCRLEWCWSNSLVNVNIGDEGSVSGKPRGCADPHQVYAVPATVTMTLVTPTLHCKPPAQYHSLHQTYNLCRSTPSLCHTCNSHCDLCHTNTTL